MVIKSAQVIEKIIMEMNIFDLKVVIHMMSSRQNINTG